MSTVGPILFFVLSVGHVVCNNCGAFFSIMKVASKKISSELIKSREREVEERDHTYLEKTYDRAYQVSLWEHDFVCRSCKKPWSKREKVTHLIGSNLSDVSVEEYRNDEDRLNYYGSSTGRGVDGGNLRSKLEKNSQRFRKNSQDFYDRFFGKK